MWLIFHRPYSMLSRSLTGVRFFGIFCDFLLLFSAGLRFFLPLLRINFEKSSTGSITVWRGALSRGWLSSASIDFASKRSGGVRCLLPCKIRVRFKVWAVTTCSALWSTNFILNNLGFRSYIIWNIFRCYFRLIITILRTNFCEYRTAQRLGVSSKVRILVRVHLAG